MGFFSPFTNWVKKAANSFSKATTDDKMKDAAKSVGHGIAEGAAYTDEGMHVLFDPRTQVKIIVQSKENSNRSASEIIRIVNQAVKEKMDNPGVLVTDTFNNLSYIFFPEFDGDMAILENMGDAPLKELVSTQSKGVIELPLHQELKIGIIEKRNLHLLSDGKYQIVDTVGNSGFSTTIKFEPTKLPPKM